MEQRTVIPAMGLGGPAGAPRPQVAMGMCDAWLGSSAKPRALDTFTAANHTTRRPQEYSP